MFLNKSQQDAIFYAFIEDGTFLFILVRQRKSGTLIKFLPYYREARVYRFENT